MRPREERQRDAGERKGDDGSGHADGVGPDGNCADLVVIFVAGELESSLVSLRRSPARLGLEKALGGASVP